MKKIAILGIAVVLLLALTGATVVSAAGTGAKILSLRASDVSWGDPLSTDPRAGFVILNSAREEPKLIVTVWLWKGVPTTAYGVYLEEYEGLPGLFGNWINYKHLGNLTTNKRGWGCFKTEVEAGDMIDPGPGVHYVQIAVGAQWDFKTKVTEMTIPWHVSSGESIQDAIDLASPGDTIMVHSGTYHENLASWKDMEITKSLSLIGAGSGSTIVELSEGNGLGGKMNGVEIRGSDLDVLLQGITFTKTPGNTYATSFPIRVAETTSTFSKLTFKDVEVAYAEASNVLLGSNGTYDLVVIKGCSFHHAGTWGFYGLGTINRMTVINSDFEYNGQVDPGHGYGFDLSGTSSNVEVTCGSFSNNAKHGINMRGISDSSFAYVTANNNGEAGIMLDHWGSGKIENITIKRPTAIGNMDGISIQPEKANAIEHVTVTGAHLTDNTRNGVNICYISNNTNNPSASDVTINFSNVYGNGNMGVRVWSWGVPITISEIFNAENNWWGHRSGPHHSSLNPDGDGDEVSDNVDFEPWRRCPIRQWWCKWWCH